MASEFSFFSRPHPLLPVAATYYLPTLEGITDSPDGCSDVDLTWGRSSIPDELVHLTAPQPNLIELSSSNFDSDGGQGLWSSSSVSSLDICARVPSLQDMIATKPSFTSVDTAYSSFERGGCGEQGQVIGPAGSLKELLGLPFMHEADSLSLTVHRVGRTLLIDHPPPLPAGAPPTEDEEELLYGEAGEGDGGDGVGRGLRERRRRRRAAQRTKKKLSAFEKALGR